MSEVICSNSIKDKALNDTLNLLSVLFYVMGGLIALFSLFPIIHFIVGFVLTTMPSTKDGEQIPKIFGLIFMILPLFFIIIGETFAICVIMAGRMLRQRHSYVFCLAIAGVLCLFMPLGTLLGVFTIITLMKEETKELFTRNCEDVINEK